MGDAPASLGIDEAMQIYGAATSEGPRKNGQAFETETGVAVAAHHLVALGSLCLLLLQVLLGHRHTARRALLRPGLFHPTEQALFIVPLPTSVHLLRMFLT